MQTNKSLFPAINNLYSLGFTDTELKKLSNFPESINLPNPELNSLRNRLCLMIRSKTTTAISGKSSYSLDTINFFKNNSEKLTGIEDTTREPIDEIESDERIHDNKKPLLTRARSSGYLVLTKQYGGTGYNTKSYGIIIKDINSKKLAKLDNFLEMMNYNRDGRYIIPIRLFSQRVFNSIDHLMKYTRKLLTEGDDDTINNLFRSYQQGSRYRETVTKFLGDIFGKKISHHKFNFDKSEGTNLVEKFTSVKYMRLITDVFEVDNIRFYILAGMSYRGHGFPSSNQEAYYYKVQKIDHTNHIFDYIDTGRLYLCDSEYITGGMQRDSISVIFSEESPVLPKDFVIEDYMRNRAVTAGEILDSNDVLMITKRYEQRISRKENKEKKREKLNEKIKNKIKVLGEGGKLTINGVTYRKDSIEYEGQKLTLDTDAENWAQSILLETTRFYDLDRITFDNILHKYLELINSKRDSYAYTNNGVYKTNPETGSKFLKGSIGDVSFKIEIKILQNKDGIRSERAYINNCRINRDEIRPCIERGLCFLKQSDFDYFLKEVSKCSLKFHRYIGNGVDIRVRDNFENAELNIKLVIKRYKNLNYLSVGGNKYKIRDTQKIIKLEKSRDLMDIVNLLMNSKVVEGVSIKDIKSIIDGAKKAYITAVEKSKKLLRDTEKVFNIKIEHHKMQNGDKIEGWKIKGKKRTYVLESKEDPSDGNRNRVYEYPSGRYVCIVDKSNSQVGTDKAVNRIYALHNDSYLATQISTL